MSAFYNEIDPFAAQWLRNLIAAGHIADGVVDERRVEVLEPDDVRGPGQRHFFAGIAGWSHALRLAGVPDDADAWTGSCPCQPFSDAGHGTGFDDERHLWPEWFRLIRECRPVLVFGEQVASRAGLAWLDAVHADLEGAGYTVRAADLCAASVGAPHRRQRLFFVAYAHETGRSVIWGPRLSDDGDSPCRDHTDRRSEVGRMADSNGRGWDRGTRDVPPRGEQPDAAQGGAASDCACWDPECGHRKHGWPLVAGQCRKCGSMADSAKGRRSPWLDGGQAGTQRGPGSTHGGWEGCDWIPCSDGVSRPVESGTHPLAHGVPAGVGKLRAYGNAIVPQVAAAFIRAALGVTA